MASWTGQELEMTSISKKPAIAIIGASSMVGSRFCEIASWANLIKTDRDSNISLDIIQEKSIDNFFKKYNFDYLILFSAFTDVDKAEKQRNDKDADCWQINVEGVRKTTAACKKYQKKLIVISTDFVFDGTAGPYSEDDPTGPNYQKVSWYGLSKAQGEQASLQNASSIILRIAYPYRSKFAKKDDIVKRILKLYDCGQLYPMFDDQLITPTFIDDLSPAIHLLISKNVSGIFHVASEKVTTQYLFAKNVLEIFGRNTKNLQKKSAMEFLKQDKRTPRPIKGGLKVTKIMNLGFKPTNWEEGLREIFRQSRGQLI